MALESVDDDEALARALQEEYEREYRRSITASQRKRTTASGFEPGSVPVEPDAANARQLETQLRYSNNRLPSGGNQAHQSSLAAGSAHTSQRSSSRNSASVPRGRIVQASEEPTEAHMRSSSFSNLDSQSQRRLQQMEAAKTGTSVRTKNPSGGMKSNSSSRRNLTPVFVPEYINNSESNIEVYSQDHFPSVDEADNTYGEYIQGRRNRDESAAEMYSSPKPMRARSGSGFSDRTPVAALSDEELARRIEQELRDEEYAQRLSRTEMEIVSQQRAQEVAAAGRARRPCTFGRVCSYLIPITVILAAAAALTYYFTGNGKLPDFIPDPEAFRQEDPFTQQDPGQANKWKIDGMNGLNMVVLNALDSKWHQNFYTAVSEWDSGNPDALTLQTEVRTPDASCEAVNGRIKVCNGNYGETNWRGINKVLLDPVYIYASSAKMNEYYFQDSSYEQMQYTMCHEIGHGFGLPHTDENFYNKDQGNCMDYTNNPKANMQPSTVNFDFLAQLYGTVDQQAASQEQVPNSGNRRSILSENEDEPLPEWIRDAMQSIDKELDSGSFDPTEMQGWRMLHQSAHGEAHEIEIGRGFKVQVHVLFA